MVIAESIASHSGPQLRQAKVGNRSVALYYLEMNRAGRHIQVYAAAPVVYVVNFDVIGTQKNTRASGPRFYPEAAFALSYFPQTTIHTIRDVARDIIAALNAQDDGVSYAQLDSDAVYLDDEAPVVILQYKYKGE